MAVPELCWTDPATGKTECRPLWDKKKPETVNLGQDPEPQPDWAVDVLNLVIIENAVAQLKTPVLRDRLTTVVEEALAEVAKNLGPSATLTRSFG